MGKNLQCITHTQKDLIWVVTTFELWIFKEIKREIEDVEKKIKWKQQQVSKVLMEDKFREWIYGPSFSQSNDTKIDEFI